jgi:CHAT domain-containing protein
VAVYYAKAEPLHRQAREIAKQALGDKHPDYATSLDNLAELYRDMGDYAQAEPLYQQAREIYKQALGEKHPDYATSLNNLALLYWEQRDYAQAEPLFQQAREIRRQALGERHPDYAISLNNLALLHWEQGDYAKAELLFRQAREILGQALGEKHPRYALSLDNLATLYKDQGDYAKAESIYRQAREIRKQALGDKHPDYADSLHNLGELYQAQEDYAQAEPLYQQAGEIYKQALGDKHPHYAIILHNLAELYRHMGDYAQAEPLYQQAREITRQALGEKHPDYATSLNNLALLYQAQGDYAKAEPLAAQAARITRWNLDLTAATQSERQQLLMSADLRYRLDHYLSVALRSGRAGSQAYGDVLAWKGAVLQRQRHLRLAQGADDPRTRELLTELQTTTSRLTALAFATPANPRQQAAWQARISKLSEDKERLERQLAQRSPAFRRLQEQQRLGPAQLQAALPHDAVLLDLLEYRHYLPPTKDRKKESWERRLAAFIVRPGRDVTCLDLGPGEPIARAIAQWRQATAGTKPDPAGATKVATELRRRLWEPFLPYLKGARTILLSPDGEVGRFPLAALPGARPGSYLLEEYALAVVPAPQLLPELLQAPAPAQAPGERATLLLLGGVDFDARPGPPPEKADPGTRAAVLGKEGARFAPLPGTLPEIEAIRAAFRRRHPDGTGTELRGGAATEAALRAQSRGQHYLHLATHGYFAPPSVVSALARPAHELDPTVRRRGDRHTLVGHHPGLLSGLALAGANRGAVATADGRQGDDGILTALEVTQLDLRAARLVVLSACETGLGRTAGGEGLLGLQQAFQAAGARALVASLWKVDDAATSVLMEEFYANLWQEKMSKLEALRQAQLTVLKHPGRVQQRREELREALAKRGVAEEELAARGFGKEAGALPNDGPTEPAARRSPPAWWAAFVLSGDWR